MGLTKEIIHPKRVYDPSKLNPTIFPRGAPWSQTVRARGSFVFISGQTARDKEGNLLAVGDIVQQTRISLENLKSILEELGGSLDNVVSTTWYTTSIDDFYGSGATNIRNEYFKKDFPSTALLEVKRLGDPRVQVEVTAIAVFD